MLNSFLSCDNVLFRNVNHLRIQSNLSYAETHNHIETYITAQILFIVVCLVEEEGGRFSQKKKETVFLSSQKKDIQLSQKKKKKRNISDILTEHTKTNKF